MIVLPKAEDRTIVSLFLWTKHRNVTDRQTDGQTVRGYYSCLHCKQCGRAVKTQINKATFLYAMLLKSINQSIKTLI